MAESTKKLSEEQLYESLKSFNVPVRMSDLKTPTRDFMIRTFECFLKDLSIDIFSPHARPWEATKHIEDPELYEDIQPVATLVLTINYIIGENGLRITLQDILDPKPKRTKKILNYLLVFWLYYLRKYSHYSDIEKTLEHEKQQISDLILEIKSKEEKYNEFMNILEERRKNEQISNISMKRQKIAKLEIKKDEVAAEYQAMKTEESNLQNENRTAEVNISTKKEKLKELDQLILSSPDRMNADLQRLKDKVKVVESKANKTSEEIKDRKMKLLDVKGCLEKDEKTMQSLQKIIEDIQDFRETLKSFIAEKEKLEEEETKNKTLQVELAEKEDCKSNQERKKAKFLLNSKLAKESLLEAFKKQEHEVSKKKEALELHTKIVGDYELKIDADARSILELHKKYKECEAEFHELFLRFEASMNNVVQDFQKDCHELL